MPKNGDYITIIEAKDAKGCNAYKGYAGIVEEADYRSFIVNNGTSCFCCGSNSNRLYPVFYEWKDKVFKCFLE